MTNLNELMEIEEKLLKYEEKEKFHMDFNEYIKLRKFLDEIGYITDKYFNLLNQYNLLLKEKEINFEAKSRLMEMLVENSKKSEIEYNLTNVNKFMKKHEIG